MLYNETKESRSLQLANNSQNDIPASLHEHAKLSGTGSGDGKTEEVACNPVYDGSTVNTIEGHLTG